MPRPKNSFRESKTNVCSLRSLNDAEKAVVSLFLEDFSYREIAEITGLTESNVGVRLNRIKNKLKKILN